MTSEIIDVPLPRASARRLINFLTFQISMFFSASFACGALMVSGGICLVDPIRACSQYSFKSYGFDATLVGV